MTEVISKARLKMEKLKMFCNPLSTEEHENRKALLAKLDVNNNTTKALEFMVEYVEPIRFDVLCGLCGFTKPQLHSVMRNLQASKNVEISFLDHGSNKRIKLVSIKHSFSEWYKMRSHKAGSSQKKQYKERSKSKQDPLMCLALGCNR